VVDLFKLQKSTEHSHGLTDNDYDALFTIDKPVVFAFHGYPWLVHRLTYNRANNSKMHVRGYKEEGTVTTSFDMTVLNELDRFHLVMDVIDRLPCNVNAGPYVKQKMMDKLNEHKHYIMANGKDMPEILEWQWLG
jgi:xylulose-5-phosphate/fructose-6-phosphate phosphoketolase